MRGALMAAALCAAAAATARARASGGGQWARLDTLLPPAVLPTLLHIAGDICELPVLAGAGGGGPFEDFEMIEHTASGKARYAVKAAKARLAGRRPAAVALYVGGWRNTVGDAAAQELIPALLTDHELVLELDVGPAFGSNYATAASRVGAVARAVAALLAAERASGAAAQLHAVGFSLGAHAASAGARAARGAGRLGRLTALDPARPCFARGAAARRWRVSRADAAFVQVVHSSAGLLGLARPLGHVDVYAGAAGGGGGAAALARDHHAAWRLWARSARASPLLARRCANSSELRAARCAGDEASVGYGCTPTMRGIFLMDS